MIKCTKCGEVKDLNFFQKHKNMKSGHINQCRDCRNKRVNENSTYEKRRDSYVRNRETRLECSKIWHKKNVEKRREWRNKYVKNRRENDNIYKLKVSISNLIRISFTNKNIIKKTKSFDILGCNMIEFKMYIESKLEPWMNWDNYGTPKDKDDIRWCLDHIIPISIADSYDKILELNHYTNFQPMEFIKNIIKSDKILP